MRTDVLPSVFPSYEICSCDGDLKKIICIIFQNNKEKLTLIQSKKNTYPVILISAKALNRRGSVFWLSAGFISVLAV